MWSVAVGGEPGWLSDIGYRHVERMVQCGALLERVDRVPRDSEGDDKADNGKALSNLTESYFLHLSSAPSHKARNRWVLASLNPMTVAREHHVARGQNKRMTLVLPGQTARQVRVE